MSRKLIVSTLAAAGLFASMNLASAADLAARPYAKAPPMVAASVYDWTGFYIGANGGWASSRNCWDMLFDVNSPPLTGPEGCHDATGGTAGGQIGYRFQRAAWVFGLEAQGNWADLIGSNTSLNLNYATAYTNRTRVDALGLFTGQVGYAVNTFLFYVKGGLAVTHNKYNAFTNAPFIAFPTGTAFDQGSQTRLGGIVGVGGEFALSPNWSIGLEYDHLFMGSQQVNMVGSPNAVVPAGLFTRADNIRQDVDMMTARINYKFGGPIVAKY